MLVPPPGASPLKHDEPYVGIDGLAVVVADSPCELKANFEAVGLTTSMTNNPFSS